MPTTVGVDTVLRHNVVVVGGVNSWDFGDVTLLAIREHDDPLMSTM